MEARPTELRGDERPLFEPASRRRLLHHGSTRSRWHAPPLCLAYDPVNPATNRGGNGPEQKLQCLGSVAEPNACGGVGSSAAILGGAAQQRRANLQDFGPLPIAPGEHSAVELSLTACREAP
jgi:hypothetical protein